MDFNAIVVCGLFLLFLCFCGAFYFQRLRWKRNKRLGMKHPGFYPTFSSLGNSLQRLQKFAQPQGTIAMQKDDEADENEEELAENGAKHLHHQLKKIRNGGQIDKLTILLRLWRS